MDIAAAFEDGSPIDKAVEEAAREAARRHKQLGLPLVVWRDGQIVWIPPEEITVDDDSPPAAGNE